MDVITRIVVRSGMPILALRQTAAVATARALRLKESNSGIDMQQGQNQPEPLEIEAKKNSVETWLRSQLSLEGSCKTMIEAHLMDKFRSRSVAEKKIRWDMAIFIVYMFFLLFYSIAACGTETKGKQLVRTLIEPAVGDLSSVKTIGLKIFCSNRSPRSRDMFCLVAGDIYTFLETVTVPMTTDGGPSAIMWSCRCITELFLS